MNPIHNLRAFGLILGILVSFPAEAKQPGTIKETTTITMGSESITLQAGQTVQVISTANGKDMISFTREDGSLAIAQIAADEVTVAAQATPPVASTPSSTSPIDSTATNPPPAATTPPASITAPAPPTTTPSAGADPFGDPASSGPATPVVNAPLHPGWQVMQFKSLHLPADVKIPTWLSLQKLDAKKESFLVYAPKNFTKTETYGLLTWLDPTGQGRLPAGYEEVLDNNNIILIGPQNAFLEADSPQAKFTKPGSEIPLFNRSFSLALWGENALMSQATIDPEKHYVGGFGFGAQSACVASFALPGHYRAVLAWGGAQSCNGSMLQNANKYWESYSEAYHVTPPTDIDYTKIRHTHYAFLAGTLDPVLEVMRDMAVSLRGSGFHAKVFPEDKLGHQVGSPETTQQALDYLKE